MRQCHTTESLLFIAAHNDTLSIPLVGEQAFCTISSTNPVSGKLLEVEALKEEMILDFMDATSQQAKTLLLNKWFRKFQDFGMETTEPLVELYCHDFLSDRKSETYEYYLEELGQDPYYDKLLKRLEAAHQHAAFVQQYKNELASDRVLVKSTVAKPRSSTSAIFITAFLAIMVSGLAVSFWALRKKRVEKYYNLTPQEQKIAEAIKSGKTNKEIAAELFISLSTVKTHINNIYKKLGIGSRAELRSRV